MDRNYPFQSYAQVDFQQVFQDSQSLNIDVIDKEEVVRIPISKSIKVQK